MPPGSPRDGVLATGQRRGRRRTFLGVGDARVIVLLLPGGLEEAFADPARFDQVLEEHGSRTSAPRSDPYLLPMRIDHVGLDVTDYERSKAFYEKALAPLGMRLMMEPAPKVGGFGGDFPFFWIGERDRGPQTGVHVAITAKDRAMVDAFHSAALEAGGEDNGGPGVREVYHPDYYGAFVLDPDGNNIEAVCHKPG